MSFIVAPRRFLRCFTLALVCCAVQAPRAEAAPPSAEAEQARRHYEAGSRAFALGNFA